MDSYQTQRWWRAEGKSPDWFGSFKWMDAWEWRVGAIWKELRHRQHLIKCKSGHAAGGEWKCRQCSALFSPNEQSSTPEAECNGGPSSSVVTCCPQRAASFGFKDSWKIFVIVVALLTVCLSFTWSEDEERKKTVTHTVRMRMEVKILVKNVEILHFLLCRLQLCSR